MRFMAKSTPSPKVGDLVCIVERSQIERSNDGRERLVKTECRSPDDDELKAWAEGHKRVSLSIKRVGAGEMELLEHRQCKGNEALSIMRKVYSGAWEVEQAADIAESRKKKHGTTDSMNELAASIKELVAAGSAK